MIPGPDTLVASMTLLRSRLDSHPAMIRSVSPWVCALVGTGYISAVSRKFTPYSSNATSSCSTPSASVFCCPHVIVPRHTLDTSRSEEPSFVYCIGLTGVECAMPRTAHPYAASAISQVRGSRRAISMHRWHCTAPGKMYDAMRCVYFRLGKTHFPRKSKIKRLNLFSAYVHTTIIQPKAAASYLAYTYTIRR